MQTEFHIMTISIDDSIKVQFNADGTVKAIYDIYNDNWVLEDFDSEKTFALTGESIVITEYDDGVLKKTEIYSPSTTNIVDPNPSIQGVILYRSSRARFDGDDDRDMLSGSSYDDNMYCMGGNDDAFGGAGDDNISGGSGNDNLAGNGGNDFVRGGTGIDRLTGGTAADRFRFDTAASKTSSNRDLVTDFSRSSGDKLSFSKKVYGGFGTATGITSAQLRAGAGVIVASNTTQRFLYDTTTGILRFDRDGSGSSYSVLQIAQLGSSTTHPTLASTDFQLS
jgi:Ca2+-binding RTX toxin-like protein